MKLSELLREVPGVAANGPPNLEISSITVDSRQVSSGGLFVAIRGTNDDGHRYLSQVEAAGAAAVVGQQGAGGLDIPYIQVGNSRLAYAHLAAAWYRFPARQLVMIGVTGTDGKTTTAALLYEILQSAGLAVGLISTVQAKVGDEELETGLHVTTPDPMDLQALLARMHDAGLTHCVLETTSHGLAQERVAACDFDVGVVTNITHEHLDFHGSFEAYQAAKGRLFAGLTDPPAKAHGQAKLAVLNRDDAAYEYLSGITTADSLTYGFHSEADVRGFDSEADRSGIRFTAQVGDRQLGIRSGLLGEYNASNVLAAISASSGLGIEPDLTVKAIQEFEGVPGRMERIELGQRFAAIVDFAHTPNALRSALQTARKLTDGRVISVFGSAGLRDRAKRRMMAEISIELADLTVLTAEDPRTEPLDQILEEMAEGARAARGTEQQTFWRVPDRADAIRFAVSQATEADLVIACGKGHEQSMCFGETEYPWDERIAMQAALAELLGVEGPAMPTLPTSGAGP